MWVCRGVWLWLFLLYRVGMKAGVMDMAGLWVMLRF